MRDKRLNELNLRPSKLNREDSKKKLNWQGSASMPRKQRELGMRRKLSVYSKRRPSKNLGA